MKHLAYVLFVLAALGAITAINNVFFGGGANRPNQSVFLLSYAVGSFLLPMLFLIGGLILLNKSKVRDKSNSA